MENSMEVPQTKNRTTIWSRISTAGYISKKKTKQKYKFKKIDASLCSQQNVVNMGAN